MSGHDGRRTLPPDLPPEYAEAYRRGYARAFADTDAAAEPPVDHEPEPTTRLESLAAAFEPVPYDDPQARPVHRSATGEERRRLFAPVTLAALAVLLILGAYGLGRVFASQVGSGETSPDRASVVLGEGGAGEGGSGATQDRRYDGPLEVAGIRGATASCQSDSSVDAAGHPVGYQPGNVSDNDPSTAWRCDGDGVGQRLTLELPEDTTIGAVGMVPGYAKTDPSNGADRYAENNRVTRARWTFADGSSVVQKLDGSAGNRDMQTIRVPETEGGRIVLEILASTPGPRNTIAISEVRIGAVVR